MCSIVAVLAGWATACPGGVGITPAFVDVRLDKGRPAGKFIVSNVGKTEERYRVRMIHFEFLENGGLRQIAPDANSLAPWVKFNPKELVLPPKSKRSVRFVIAPRGKVRAGEYWGAMELESLKAGIRSGKDAAGREIKIEVIPTILVPVFARMGEVTYRGAVTSVRLVRGKNGPVLETGVINRGAGRLLLHGNYTVTDPSGRKVAAGVCGHGYVLPGKRRRYTVPVKAPIGAGTYTASIRFASHQLKVPLSHEQSVTYRPDPPPRKKPDPKAPEQGKDTTGADGPGPAAPGSRSPSRTGRKPVAAAAETN